MDLGLTEQQSILRKTARDFLEAECPSSTVVELQENERGYAPDMWRRIVGLGWPGLVIPERYGGSGAGMVDLCVLLEEVGRALLPSPLTSTILCGLVINAVGSEQQKRELLPTLANGSRIAALALTEPSARYAADGIKLSATAHQGGFVLNGTKLFVRDGTVADTLVVVARTQESSNPQEGITLLWVDTGHPGISITPLKSIGRDRLAEVVFDNVRAPGGNILGDVGQGWPTVERILDWGALFECAEMAGGSQKALDLTVDYAKIRVQFGVPIGSFQAIQHKCADMLTDVDGSRFLTYHAAWKLDEGMPASVDIARAKAWCSEAMRRVTREAHQIFSGVAFVRGAPLYLYFQRQKAADMTWGDAEHHKKAIAAALLD